MKPQQLQLPVMVKIYNRAFALFYKWIDLQRACFTGAWLGLLSREQNHQVDQSFYLGSNMYSQVEYNTSGLFPWEQNCVEKYFSNAKTILLLAAGGGREMLALSRLGFAVDGFECNPGLRDFANQLLAQQAVSAIIAPMAPDSCPVTDRMYAGVIAGWGMYMHIQGRSHRIAFLKALRKIMLPDAPLLLSFFSTSGVGGYLRVVHFIANLFRRLLGRELVDLGDDLMPDFVHMFTKQEIIDELRAGGFRLEFYSEEEYSHAVAYVERDAQ